MGVSGGNRRWGGADICVVWGQFVWGVLTHLKSSLAGLEAVGESRLPGGFVCQEDICMITFQMKFTLVFMAQHKKEKDSWSLFGVLKRSKMLNFLFFKSCVN